MRRLAPRVVRRLVAVVIVLGVVFLGVRRVAFVAVERRGLIAGRHSGETPAAYGAPFEPVTITSGDRRLDA